MFVVVCFERDASTIEKESALTEIYIMPAKRVGTLNLRIERD